MPLAGNASCNGSLFQLGRLLNVPRWQRRIGLLVLRLVDGALHQYRAWIVGDFRGNAVSEVLRSWKEIATYADASVRTVQRWERDFGFPIRRLNTKKGAGVFAFKADLHSWLRAKTEKESLEISDRERGVTKTLAFNQLSGLRPE
jgi:hypothetical protein